MKNKTRITANVVFGILSVALLNTVNTSSVEAIEADEINPASATLCRKFPLKLQVQKFFFTGILRRA